MTAILTTNLRKAVRDALWRAGDLSWKLDGDGLHPAQIVIYEKSRDSAFKTFVTEAARRPGKTVVHAIIAVELALKYPGSRLNWGQHTRTEILSSAVPLFEKICADAPPDCRGEFKQQRNVFEFPNGSYVYFFGANAQDDADRARGGDNPIASFLDEAAFADYLEYTYVSIIKPGMRQVERNGHYGMTFLFSTTPKTPLHYFVKLADRSEARGSYCKFTIHDSPNAQRFIEEDAEDHGLTVEQFMATSHFKREYLCERELDKDLYAFPEFHVHKSTVVQAWERPIGFDEHLTKLVSVDPGGAGENADRTAVVYGYVDWLKQKIVVEDETLLAGPNTGVLVNAIKAKESVLWPSTDKIRRVIDDPTGRMCLDFWQSHKVRAEQAKKHDRQAGMMELRHRLQNGTLVIHPRCQQLQKQLSETLNTKDGKDFARNEDGHADLCAALLYLTRTAEELFHRNPYPANFDIALGRQRPVHHPLEARREALGLNDRPSLSEAILGNNKYVANGVKRKKLTQFDRLSQMLATAQKQQEKKAA